MIFAFATVKVKSSKIGVPAILDVIKTRIFSSDGLLKRR
jgi:hypothetical protein